MKLRFRSPDRREVTYHLQTEAASVDVVTEEEVVHRLDVSTDLLIVGGSFVPGSSQRCCS